MVSENHELVRSTLPELEPCQTIERTRDAFKTTRRNAVSRERILVASIRVRYVKAQVEAHRSLLFPISSMHLMHYVRFLGSVKVHTG